jgi:hypothetical protein
MEPDSIERIGQGPAPTGTLVVEVVTQFVVALVRLADGLVVVAVAWPHRRPSVPTTRRNATAGRRAAMVVP